MPMPPVNCIVLEAGAGFSSAIEQLTLDFRFRVRIVENAMTLGEAIRALAETAEVGFLAIDFDTAPDEAFELAEIASRRGLPFVLAAAPRATSLCSGWARCRPA